MPSEEQNQPFDSAKFLVERGWLPEIALSDFQLGCRIVEKMRGNQKGLILSGDYGVGKTAFVKAVFHGYKLYSLPGDEWALTDGHDYTDSTLRGNVIFDDVGSEHTQNSYGVKIETFADYIVERHLLNPNGRLIITTNLTTRDFERRYGGRVVSRLKDLCYAARFSGKDKRKWDVIS